MLDLDATDDPIHGHQSAASSTVITGTIAIFRCTYSAVIICSVPGCALGHRRHAGALKHVQRIVAQIRRAWPQVKIVIRW